MNLHCKVELMMVHEMIIKFPKINVQLERLEGSR